MKKPNILIHTLLLGILISLCLVLPAFAGTAIINSSVVNIRSGPGTNYPIAGSAYQNTEVNVLQTGNSWSKVQIGQLTGWISSSLLNEKQAISLVVKNETANLRSGPGTNYNLSGQVSRGDTLTLLDVQNDWYKVKTSDGKIAYIASYLVAGADGSVDAVAQAASRPADLSSASAAATPATSTAAAGSEKPPLVMLDNKQLSFEVPPIIENDRTLVPLRAIFEAMGASVEWNNATRTVTASKAGTTVVLAIGSKTPTINGVVKSLDVPGKIVNDRTLAPLRFVGEAFGGTVAWDAATRTITITSPPAAAATGDTQKEHAVSVTVNEDLVNLRSGPATSYDKVDQAARGEVMNVLAENNGWYQVSRGGRTLWVSGQVVMVAWEKDEPAAVPVTTPAVENPPSTTTNTNNETPSITTGTDSAGSSGTTISNDPEAIRILSSKDQGSLIITIGSGTSLKAAKKESSSGITYEFENRKVEGNTYIKETLGSDVIEVRAANREDKAVIEISMPAGVKYKSTSEDGGKKEVITISNYVLGLERKTFGSGGERLIINTAFPANYTSKQNGTQMQVEFDLASIGKVRSEYSFGSELLKRVSFSEKKSGDSVSTLMVIETASPAKFAFGKDGNSLNILFINQNDAQAGGNVIVLDPGHGGSDSGARGSFLNEKDVNLDIALGAGEILQQHGMKVVYTRDDDTYVSLEDRAAVANLYNARLFVSIHNNSVSSPDARATVQGTETYYYAPLDKPELFIQSDDRARLAKCLSKELIYKLNRPDRGVKQNNYSVLRNTKMPSALAEVVFISNPAEEQLLQQEYFKGQAAQAIADGITSYCNGGDGSGAGSGSDIKI